MQVSLETTSGLERRLTIVVPAADVDGKVEERLKVLSREVRLDGFRPGKVPLKVIKRRYGRSARQEILSEVIKDSYLAAIKQQALRPAGMPDVKPKKDSEGDDFEFTATFEVYPEIELTGVNGAKFDKYVADISEDDLDKMVDKLRHQLGGFESVNSVSEKSDKLLIDFRGTIEGKSFEGGLADDYEIVLGSGSLIEGFESGIEGVMPGGERMLNLKFPDNYHVEELKGKAVDFQVNVKEVKRLVLPTLDKDFYIKFGLTEDELTEEKFRAEVKKNMERELTKAVDGLIKNQVMEYLLEINQVEVPNSLVLQEIVELQHEMFDKIFGNNKEIELKPDMLPNEPFVAKAQRRVRLGLILRQMIKDLSLEVDDEQVNAKVYGIAQSYENSAEVIRWYYNNEEMMHNIRNVVLESQLVDTVLEMVEVTKKESSYEDIMQMAHKADGASLDPEPEVQSSEKKSSEESSSSEDTAIEDKTA